jgi:hypothetical protein
MREHLELVVLLGVVVVGAFVGGLVWGVLCLLWQSRKGR